MKYLKFLLIIVLLNSHILSIAQDSLEVKKTTHTVFANIFTAGYYNFNTTKPNAGFNISTALLGYQFKKSDALKFTLIYDVTHTTSDIQGEF